MSLTNLHFERGTFQAARRLKSAPPDHPSGRRHGHGFTLEVAWTALPTEIGTEPLGRRLLAEALAHFDYQDLNEVTELSDPNDFALLQWLAECLPPGWSWLALSSLPDKVCVLYLSGERQLGKRHEVHSAHFLPQVAPGHKCGRLHGHNFQIWLWTALPLEFQADSSQFTTEATLAREFEPCRARLHRHLLNDIPGLENPTSECLASWLWNSLRTTLPDLSAVVVFETASAGCLYAGDRWRVFKDFGLESAWREVGDLLGHSFRLRLHLVGELDPILGWIRDFAEIKELFQPLYLRLDHQPLHGLEGLETERLEGLLGWIAERVRPALPELDGLSLWSTASSGLLSVDSQQILPSQWPMRLL